MFFDTNNSQARCIPEGEVLSIKKVENDTSPLTVKTVSKKHARILIALFKINNECGNGFLSVEDIRNLIEHIAGKRYPLLDIESFADDLRKRHYLTSKYVRDTGVCYQIAPDGVTLLFSYSENHREYLMMSNSPNASASTIQ